MGNIWKKSILFAATLAVVLSCCACEALGIGPAATEAVPTEKPTPEIIDLQVASTDVPAAITLTPTPEPTPTPYPVSQYAPTVNMTYEELVGSTNDMSASTEDCVGKGFPAADKYYIIVDKYYQVVMVFMRKSESEITTGEPDYDQPVRFMLCSTGNPDTEYGYETTSGIWEIDLPRERFYQFVNLEAAQYLTCIHSRTYFHSILYEKKGKLDTLIKSSYDDLGTKASHSCIRLTVPDSRWIFYNIAPGTTCEIRDGSADDTFTASVRAALKLPASKKNPSLSPKNYTWTDNWKIEDVEHVVKYKYMKPRMPDGYDENGHKIETEITTDVPTETTAPETTEVYVGTDVP